MQLETITARLQADAGQFVSGFSRAAQAVDVLGRKVPQTNQVAGVLQRGLTNLAFAAAGVPGPIGKITESMLAFAGGSTLVIGVAAGLGLIVKAYQALTREAREATKATEELIAAQLKQRQEERSQGILGSESLAQLQAAVSTARTRMEAAEEAVRSARERIAAGQGEPDLAGALRRLERAQKDYTSALMAHNRQLREQAGLETGRQREERLKAEAKQAAEMAATFEELTSAVRDTAAAMDHTLIPAFRELTAEQVKAAIAAEKLPKIVVEKENVAAIARSVKQDLGKVLNDEKAQTDFARMGEQVGNFLAEGVMHGFTDAAGLMRLVFMRVLSFALGNIFGGILGGLGGGKSAAAAAEKIGSASGIIQPANLQLAIPEGAIPAPMTPFDVARDVWWQRALRESVIVARSQGFK